MADEAPDISAYEALDAKDRRLVDTYLRNGMVQWKAYRDTIGRSKNYDVLRVESSKRFANPNIQAAITERLEQECMSTTEALARLAEQARAGQSQYLEPDGTINLAQLIEDGKAHLVRETDYKGKDAERLVVKFHDTQGALDKILRAGGAYGPTGRADDPLHAEIRFVVEDRRSGVEERKRQHERLLTNGTAG